MLSFNLEQIRKYSRQYEYGIRSTETDLHDELQLYSLMSMIQEAASVDAEICGLGAAQLDPKNLCWMLLRTSVRIPKIPKWQDKVLIDTWTNGVERLFSIREFAFTNQNGNVLGAATTSWLVTDKNSHRPQKISVLADERVDKKSLSAIGFSSPKIDESKITFSAVPVFSKEIGYSEIDRNMHVNNTRYVAWCLDAIGTAGFPTAKLIGIDINYISEVRIGETIDLYVSKYSEFSTCEEAKDAIFIAGKHRDDKKTAFLAVLFWDGLL